MIAQLQVQMTVPQHDFCGRRDCSDYATKAVTITLSHFIITLLSNDPICMRMCETS